MILFPLFLFVLTWKFAHWDSSLLVKWSFHFQQHCEGWFSPNPLQDLEKALVCGSSLKNDQLIQLLKKHSLFHLVVVSGSHFLWIHEFLKKVKISQNPGWILLWIYNLLTGFQAPGTRALIQIFLTGKGWFPRLRSDHLVFLSGVFYLLIFPADVTSLSLLLSWTAALGLSISSPLFRSFSTTSRFFLRQLSFSILLYPWMWIWGNAHPLTLFSNLLLGPLILGILFPYALLDLIFHFPWTWNQYIASSFEKILSGLGDAHLIS